LVSSKKERKVKRLPRERPARKRRPTKRSRIRKGNK
jgi:hypothetical protein